MGQGIAPPFPGALVIAFAFGCAVCGAAALLTSFTGAGFRLWWNARQWTGSACTVLQVEPEIRYRYEFGGRSYESGALGIGSEFGNAAQALGGQGPGARLVCWVNPVRPEQALLHRTYSGWWWLPGAWLLGAFLLLPVIPGLLRALWLWLTYRPDPPLTWAQWFASFYQGNAWPHLALGLACLIPGLAAIYFLTIVPWSNWRMAQSYMASSCTVTRSELRGWSGGSGREAAGGYRLEIAFTYEHGGLRYSSSTYSPWRLGRVEWELQGSRLWGADGAEALLSRLAVGTRHECYIAPRQPGPAYLSRQRTGYAAYAASIGPFLALMGLCILAARPRL